MEADAPPQRTKSHHGATGARGGAGANSATLHRPKAKQRLAQKTIVISLPYFHKTILFKFKKRRKFFRLCTVYIKNYML
jgi:hypothetical protein